MNELEWKNVSLDPENHDLDNVLNILSDSSITFERGEEYSIRVHPEQYDQAREIIGRQYGGKYEENIE